MSSAVSITFPRDQNGEAIPILRHDFNNQVAGCVMLAGSSVAVDAQAVYRYVGNTDALVAYGDGSIAALCRINGMVGTRIPIDQIEYIVTDVGQTSLSVVSEYADGGCFDLIRMS